MKNSRKTKICSSLLAIFIIVTVFFSNSLSAFAYNYDGTEYTQVPGTVIYYDAYVTPEELNEVILQYNNLPYSIKQYMAEHGIKIYVRTLDPIQLGDNTFVGGCAFLPRFSYYANSMKIDSVDYSDCRIEYYDKDSSASDGILYHETGHLVDFFAMDRAGVFIETSCGISTTEEWKAFYTTYYNQLVNYDYLAKINYSRNAREGLAEAARILYTDPQWLISHCPDLYNYLIQNFSNAVGGDCTSISTVTVSQTIDNFDYIGYADTYPDLYAAFGYDKQSLYNHYVNCGRAEGRIANFNGSTTTPSTAQTGNVPQTLEHFDYTTYANTYPDLYAAFGYNAAALYNHYLTYGMAEGRIATFR